MVGLYRWSVVLLRLFIGRKFYRPIKGNPKKSTVTFVVPVYNEPIEVLNKALISLVRNNPDEIIYVIDSSSSSCIELVRKYSNEHTNIKIIVTDKPGKRPALVDGIEIGKGEVFALIDSDVILADNCLEQVLIAFGDPSVGAVTTRQCVIEPNGIIEVLQDIFWSLRYNEELPALAALGSRLPTLSGRCAFYYGEDIKKIAPGMLVETFLGVSVISGEDKFLTRSIHGLGKKSFYQSTARIFTTSPSDLKTLLKQRLRWGRNTWRSDMFLLSKDWFWRDIPLVFHTLNNMFMPFLSLLAPLYIFVLLLSSNYLFAFWLMCWLFASRYLRLLIVLDERRWQISYFFFFSLSMLLFQLLKLYALATCNKQGWITRWDPSRDKKRPLFSLFLQFCLSALTIIIALLVAYFLTPIYELIIALISK